MDVGARLKEIRDKTGHTQDSLAEATGYSRQHIQKIENNASSPTVKALEALLPACKTTLAEFFKSKIPEKYENPAHQALHEMLQEILEVEDHVAIGIRTSILGLVELTRKERRAKEKTGTDDSDGQRGKPKQKIEASPPTREVNARHARTRARPYQ